MHVLYTYVHTRKFHNKYNLCGSMRVCHVVMCEQLMFIYWRHTYDLYRSTFPLAGKVVLSTIILFNCLGAARMNNWEIERQ